MKQCTCCREVKPLDGFSSCGGNRRYAACRKCRSKQQVVARRRRKGTIKTEWALPEMSLVQQLECVRLRKWSAPVFNRGPLTWRLSA